MPRQSKELEELRKVRERTLLGIERLREELHAEIEPASATDDDSADVAADIYERGKVLSLIQSLEAKLHSLDEAIARAIARAGDKTYTYTQIASDAGVSVSAISRYFQRIRGDRS